MNPSPLRYPGGKHKIYRYISDLVSRNECSTYIEPFCGGAAVAFDLLFDGAVNDIIINDFDYSVFCFWHCVLYNPESICRKIRDTAITLDEWHRQKDIRKHLDDYDELDIGFSTLFLNRTNRSGIIDKAGPIGGLQQTGNYPIDCRFNKDALIAQIERIGKICRIKIEDILNYYENPRHAVAVNEKDTLKKLFAAVGNQYMLNLAEDIQEHGTLGNQQIAVVYSKEQEKYVVYEGNRRVAALKLLRNPDYFDFLDSPTRARAKSIASKGVQIKDLACYVTNEEEAFFIMERTHSGEDKGRGVKSWTAREKEAFKVRRNKSKNLSYLIDIYVKKYFDGFDITTVLPFTTIQRIFNNREVRKVIGTDVYDESTFTHERMQLILDASLWIRAEADTTGVSVTRLFNKEYSEDRKVRIRQLLV